MAKHNRNRSKDLSCPECNGSGFLVPIIAINATPEICWNCLGTKTATDEPSEERDWEREN